MAHDLIYDLTVLVAVRRLGEDSYYDLKSTVYNSKILKLIGCVAPEYHESALSTIDDWHTAYTAFFDQIERVLFVYTAPPNEEDAPIESANITFSNINIPTTTNEWRMMYLDRESTHVHDRGTSFSLKGTITSDNLNIVSVTCQVVNERTGAIPQQKTVQCNTKSLNISSQIDSYIKFAQIPVGHYRLKYTATLSDGTKQAYISDLFAVMEFYDYTRPNFTVTVDADNNLIASWTSSGDYVTHYSIHLYSQNGIVNNPAPVLKKVSGDILSYNLGQFSPGTYEFFVIPSTRDTEYGLYSHYYDYGDKIIYKVNVGNSQSFGSGVANVYDYSSEYKTSKWYRQLMEVRLTGNQRQDIVNVARSQIGYHEGNNRSELHGNNASGYGNFTEYAYYMGKYVYNEDLYASWCAMFVSWCARQADIPTDILRNSTTVYSNGGFNVTVKKRGSYTPQIGDLIYIETNSNPADGYDHVGIVSNVTSQKVTFIDGNSSSESVRETSKSINDSTIYGYGVPAYQNVHVHTPGAAATCTSDQTCTVCGVIVKNKLGHSYNAVVTAPTCTTEGFTTHTCTRCGDSYTDSKVSAKGHTPGAAATCTSNQTCTVCGAIVTNKLGHTYTAKVTAPTCTAGGYTTHTCTHCGDTYTDNEIPSKGHTPVVVPEVYPTPETEGLTEGSVCQECGDILIPQEPIPKQDIITGSVNAGGVNIFFTINFVTGDMTIQGDSTGEMGNYTGICNDREFIWYKYEKYIKRIIVEESVTSVGDYAFFGLSSLEEVVLPDSVVHIGQAAFSECSSLSKIHIPNSVKSIGSAALSCCSSLTECNLPVGLDQISKKLFIGCVSLSKVTIPGTVTSIESQAFESCESLAKVDIPDGVMTIKDSAFRHCTSLVSVSLPTTLKSVWGCAFDYCPALTVAKYNGTEEEWNKEVTVNQNATHDDCNQFLKNALTFHVHSYTSQVVIEEYFSSHATCTTPATYYYSCSCGEKGTETFTYGATIPHTEETIPAIPATCTGLGKTEGSKCSVCGEILVKQTTVAPLGHTETALPAKEATCTEAGLTAGTRCAVCGETLISQKEIPAKGHAEVIDTAKNPTCTETGLTEGKHCSTCGKVLVAQTEISAKGHAEVIDPAKSPTCTETGLTEGKHCSTCDEILVAQTEVAATGHTPGDWTTTVEPAIGTEGKKQQSCNACGAILNEETIPTLPEETEPVTEPDTAPETQPEPETDPVTEAPTEAPSDDPAITEESTAEESSTIPTVTGGCSGSILSCGLLMLVALAGAALIKRKE